MAQAAAAPAAEAPAPVKKTGLLIGLTLGGAVLGGLLAAFVVAPRIIARQAPAAVDSADAAGEHGTVQKERGGEPAKLVELENLIVNPAGSQGNRFLMTSVAFAVADEKGQKLLDDSKVELRDRVTGVLENMTMAQLTAPGARDTLKARIAVVAGELLGPKTAVRVFLPQFVIQ
jgi:flagellar basal body-associated protein FliL